MCSSLSLLTADRNQLAEQIARAQVMYPVQSQLVRFLSTGLGQHQPQAALVPCLLPTPSISQSIPLQPTCRLQLLSSSRSWRLSRLSRQSTALRWRGGLLRRSVGQLRARQPARTHRRSCWQPGSTSRSSAARCTSLSRQSSSCGPRWVGPAVAWQVMQERATPVIRISAGETAANKPEVYGHTAAEGTCRVAVQHHEDKGPLVKRLML